MKPSRSILTAALALAAYSASAWAEIFPVFEDAAGSTTTISAASGKAKTLAISAKSSAFINFAVSSGQGDPVFNIDPATVTGARLVIFLAKASKTGTLTISNLNTAFTETSAKPITSPTVGTALGTIPLASFTPSLNADYFITDITAQVKLWLTNFNPNTEFGVAITSDGTATATLASKEGAGSGHAAFIEIDINKGGGTVTGTSAVFTGGVTAGSFSSTGAFAGNTGTFTGALSGTTGTFSGALTGAAANFSGALTGTTGTFSGALGIGGDLSAAGNIVLSFAANRTVSVAPEPTNGTNGHSLTIKAGNANSAGNQARTGGDLILEAGTGFNGNQNGIDGGDLILRSGANLINGTDNGGDIIFQVGAGASTFIEKARLLESGNFGIGTATPDAPLTIQAGTSLQTWKNGSGVTKWGLNIDAFGANTGLFFSETNVNASNLVLKPGGNIGIGTSTPGAKLHVVIPTTGVGQENAFQVGKNDSTFANAILVMRTFGSGLPFNVELSQGDAFKPGGGAWGVFSDRRLKKNIEPLSGALDRLMQLRSVTYEYIDPTAVHELPGVQTGFIAQEVEPIFPGWVGERTDGMKYVAVKGFESLTVQALRELRSEKDAEIAALKQKVAALEARDAAREARLTRLENALDASPARTVRASLDFK